MDFFEVKKEKKMGYVDKKDIVLGELQETMGSVQEKDVSQLVDEICRADKVFVVGVGRVLLMLQAFAKRLNHLGIRANFVGAIDEPAITDKDILLVGSGSGESVFPLAIVKLAKKYQATVIHIGSNPQSAMTTYEDLFIRIPCATKLNLKGEIQSRQIMSSLFEQSLMLLLDVVSIMLAEKMKIDDLHSLWQYHANLE